MPHRRHAKTAGFTKAQVHEIKKLAEKEIEEEVPDRYQLQMLTNAALNQKGGASLSLSNLYAGPTADVTKLGIIDTSGGVQYIQLNPYSLCKPANGYERCKLAYLDIKAMVDCGTSDSSLVRVEVIQYRNVPTDVAFTPYYPNVIATSSAVAPDPPTLAAMSALTPDASWLTTTPARDVGFKYKWLFRETMYFDSVKDYAMRPLHIRLTEKHLGAHGVQIFDEAGTSSYQGANPIYLIVYSVQRIAAATIGLANYSPATARINGCTLKYLLKDLRK